MHVFPFLLEYRAGMPQDVFCKEYVSNLMSKKFNLMRCVGRLLHLEMLTVCIKLDFI